MFSIDKSLADVSKRLLKTRENAYKGRNEHRAKPTESGKYGSEIDSFYFKIDQFIKSLFPLYDLSKAIVYSDDEHVPQRIEKLHEFAKSITKEVNILRFDFNQNIRKHIPKYNTSEEDLLLNIASKLKGCLRKCMRELNKLEAKNTELMGHMYKDERGFKFINRYYTSIIITMDQLIADIENNAKFTKTYSGKPSNSFYKHRVYTPEHAEFRYEDEPEYGSKELLVNGAGLPFFKNSAFYERSSMGSGLPFYGSKEFNAFPTKQFL